MKMHTGPIFYICNDAERALGLELALPNFHIICIDDNPIVDFIAKSGGKIFCLERELDKLNPIFRNSHRLLQQKSVESYISQNTPEGITPNIIVFKIAPNIEKLCQDRGYNLLNTSAELNKKFELKLSQYEHLKDCGIRFPETTVGKLKDFEYDELSKKLGGDFVIQYDRGHTGKSTVFIESQETFAAEQTRFPDRLARISQLIRGEYWTLNACITRFGTLFGGISYQITGVPECTNKEGATVGNDWSRSLGPESSTINTQFQDFTLKIGEVMKSHEFRGLYGIDFVVDDQNQVFFIEVNARQPASTSMHTKLMLKHKRIPLQAFHIAEFLFDDDSKYFAWLNDNFEFKIITGEEEPYTEITKANIADLIYCQNHMEGSSRYGASQLFIRNTDNSTVEITGRVEPGIYKISGDYTVVGGGKVLESDKSKPAPFIERVRDGYSIADITDLEEFLVLAVSKGHKVSPGSEIARLQVPDTILEDSGRRTGKPKDWALRTVREIRNEIV